MNNPKAIVGLKSWDARDAQEAMYFAEQCQAPIFVPCDVQSTRQSEGSLAG